LEEVNKDIVKQLRVNERIIAREVRLVGEKGEQLGIMTLAQAREVAKKQMLDIVEVAPTSVPPVCRLLDYGKYKYEQAKKEQQARKSQKAKARTARKLLIDGDKVKVTLMFRGRESTHPELGWKVLQRMVESLSEVSSMERKPIMEGRRMNIILAPTALKEKTKEEAKKEVKEEVKETQNAETQNS